jgi:hypothetical protein
VDKTIRVWRRIPAPATVNGDGAVDGEAAATGATQSDEERVRDSDAGEAMA